jgi:soluble lytic murein transglycosylase
MLTRYRDSIRVWSDPIGRLLFRLHLRPNHLTMLGLAVSLLSAAAFIAGQLRWGGVLLILAGLFDLLDGSLARVSGQVTPFGAFLDSVIDRYSDLVVLLGIVVLFAQTPHTRGALVAMAGLVGSVMVSYTKARAESIGVQCNVGFMERPERMICLVAGALLNLLEPALWTLAVLANLTALQRILFTRRVARAEVEARRPSARILGALLALPLLAGVAAAEAPGTPDVVRPTADVERTWTAAVAALQQGDPVPVLSAFAAEVALAGPIGDYARFLLADAHARRGDPDRARAVAVDLVDRHPESRLAPRALLKSAALASRAGDEAASQQLVKRVLAAYPDAAEVPEALYLLGQSAEALGDRTNAAHAYRELRILAPASSYAEGAADRLEVLAAAGVRVPELSIAERIDRAERLLRSGVPRIAADEAERVVAEARDPAVVLRALRVVADGATQQRRLDVAAKALEQAVARAPAEQRRRLQLEQAVLLTRAGQRERALNLFTAVAGHGPETEASEALLRKARLLDDMERTSDAAATYRAVATRFPGREVAGAALWRLGWLAYLRNDLRGAEAQWARLLDLPGGRAHRLPALYWQGRALELLKGRPAAEPLFAQIATEAPRSYYGMLAAQRLTGERESTARVALRLPADPAEAIAADPGFARVDLLRRVGLVEDAWLELESVVQRAVGDTVRLYGFSNAYVRDERYHLALRIFRRHFASLAVSGDPALPRAFWEMLYPLGWRDDVARAARGVGLDPFLVAAVVREESSYYPRAVSRAGARGLMQLMPDTARTLAPRIGLSWDGVDMLEEPRANLEMGTFFLAALLREFGDPRLALAAYNAGPSRVRAWWRDRRTSDLEAWVEQIPFDETRHYVKRVLLSWQEYKRIYGDE